MKPIAPYCLLVASVLLSGCVSSKYKLAKATTATNPVILDLSASQPPVTATVKTLIPYKGPGSWKNEAYWDEYVLCLTNSGESPLLVSAATLQDGRNPPLVPGDEPWVLEKSSRTAAAHNFGLAKNTVVQLGGGLATVVGGGIVGSLIAPAGWIVPAGLGPGLLVGLPVAIGGTIYRNVTHRREIEAEFTRRRLALPLTLAPGQSVQGSLFFRITPSPQHLVLTTGATGDARPLTVDLAPLANLHLKDKTAVASAATAASTFDQP